MATSHLKLIFVLGIIKFGFGLDLIRKGIDAVENTVDAVHDFMDDSGIAVSCFSSVMHLADQWHVLSKGQYNIENNMNTIQILQHRKYPHEVFQVFTPDGYILTLIRITGSPFAKNVTKGKYPIFIQHGLFQDSAMAVANPRDYAIGLWFADRGHDVFLGNARGTQLSKKHKTLSGLSPYGPYWNFSYHEKGIYDIPTFIDKVLEVSGKKKLNFIGHSEGTTEFFVAASVLPEIQEKINLMFALGPAATLIYTAQVGKIFCAASLAEQQTGGNLNFLELDPSLPTLLHQIIQVTCPGSLLPGHPVCESLLAAISGISNKISQTSASTLIAHSRQSVSVKEIQHLCQSNVIGKFTKYDYGIKNPQFYNGSKSPPSYDLGKIKTKIFLFSGTCDIFTAPGDAKKLDKNLPNAELVSVPQYNHLDYVFATDAPEKVYSPILNEIRKYEKNATGNKGPGKKICKRRN